MNLAHAARSSIYGIAVATTVCALCTPLAAFADAPLCSATFTRTLATGATGPEVLQLQKLLNASADTRITDTGDGSPGHETMRFGALTRAAVIRFQEKYAGEILTPNGIAKGTGAVRAATRAKLNALCAQPVAAATSTNGMIKGAATTTITTPALIITAAEQPAATLAPANALYVPFTTFTATAQGTDVTIHSVTVERIGPAQDQAFADWDLFDTDDNYYGLSYFNSNHSGTVKKDIVIPAGTSKTFNIVGDMAADLTNYDGQMAGMRVIAIDASVPVQGALPIAGTLQTINSSLVLGTPHVTLSSEDPNTARTRYINDTRTTFSAIRITTDSIEDELLTSIMWRQVGSAAASDVANIMVVVNGSEYPVTVEGRDYTASFGDGIKIAKGQSLDVAIRGDLTTTGSNRTVQFNINDGSDIGLQGTLYGYYLFPIPDDHTDTLESGNHSIFATSDGTTDGDSMKPFFIGSETTISPGGVTYIGQ